MESVDSKERRLMGKRGAFAAAAALLVAGGLFIWLAVGWIDGYTERTAGLLRSSPRAAAAALASQLRLAGAINAAVLALLAWYLAWRGWLGMKAASIPPGGASAPDRHGERGPVAGRAGRWLVVLAVILAGCALGVALVAWHVAGQIDERAVPGPDAQLPSFAMAAAGIGPAAS